MLQMVRQTLMGKFYHFDILKISEEKKLKRKNIRNLLFKIKEKQVLNREQLK
jgi:hypothetical protein